ncbi:MAG: peptidoglycan-binding protein [Hyphomonadaceae bacterium]|nr:peptidoglycan-binding protein [Hyphomonadaceae bacterium]
MSQAPWSVKGIDPKARELARERAQRQGVTLGQYLNSLLLEGDSAAFEEIDLSDTLPRPSVISADHDLRRMSQEIDMLSQRLEASTSRSARAVSGIDKSILGLMGKVDASGKAQLQALERVTRALGEIETTQTALRSRIETIESGHGNAPTLDALKTLEASLGRLSETVQSRAQDEEEFRALFDDKVNRVASKVDDVARSVDATVTNAIRSNASGLAGRVDQIEEKMSSVERRIEAGINKITDAATRFELFETKAERAVGDTTWRMERALETTLNRSRAMSKEVLDRVDGIEEKTREAMNGLGDAVARITERVTRAERKSDTAMSVLERAVTDIDERVQKGGGRQQAEDFAQLQVVFQKRLDSLAEDLSRPIHAVRADVERRLEEVTRAANPEKLERLERTIRQLQEQIQVTEARQADAVEAMSSQVDRLSRAVDERLRSVEARNDQRSIDDVRREMTRLADTIDARLDNVETSGRAAQDAIGRLNTAVDDKLQALEKRGAGAIDAVGEQVALVAERLQKRHDDSVQRLSDRIAETATAARPLDNAEVDRLADRLDERVKESERRSAEAIGQIGEQVARVADRLQTQHAESLRAFETRLSDSGRSYENKLSDVLSEVQRRMEEVGDQSTALLGPMQKTVSSIARRLEGLEDTRRDGLSPEVTRDIPVVPDEYVILDDDPIDPVADVLRAAPAAFAAIEQADAEIDTADIVGVEPPPFDRKTDPRDAHLFSDDATDAAPIAPPPPPASGEAAKRIEDLLETDDVFLGPPPAGEFVADLPSDDSREKLAPGYLEEARRAARQGRRIAPVTAKKGIGKGPLIASGMLAVAVAGGAAFTVMRGKQEAQSDDFAKQDPAAPAQALAAPGTAEAVLFNEPADEAAALQTNDLFEETPATAAASATKPADAAKAAAAPAVTLADAVRSGDPVALLDYALELLQSGDKAKGVQVLKDAAGRGLVMADYRLAKLYERGEGVPRDMAASRQWTEKAAVGGNVKAMHDLAVFYAEGDAGPQSYAAAVEWFRQASDHGLVDSQYNLAVLYEKGLGLTQDKSEAAYWYEVAGRAGDQDAGRRARTILGEMQPTQAEAIKRKARAFAPKPGIARANGEFGRRAWDIASPAQVTEAQRLLVRLGFAPGTADGKMNARTAEAIREFERDNDLPVTGEASVSLLRQLRAATLNITE